LRIKAIEVGGRKRKRKGEKLNSTT